MPNLCLFDLDHTIIGVDSDHSWGQFLVEQGLVDEQVFKKANDDFYHAYLDGTLDPVVYNEFVASFLKQHPMEQLLAWREQFLTAKIRPHIRAKAMACIDEHQRCGDAVLITSSTNDFVVVPIAQMLGVPSERVFATRLEVVNNAYTGKVVGRPNFQAGKIYHLTNYLAKEQAQGVTYQKTYAYSDSKNDLPLLTWADVAVCVCPDDVLHAYALDKDWQVVDWS